MVCIDCETIKMNCTNTRERDNVRYRIYVCPECGFKAYTKESEILTKDEFSEAYNVMFAHLDELRGKNEKRNKTIGLQ